MNNRHETGREAQAPDRVCVACPKCGRQYRVPTQLLGRRLACRHCRHAWRARNGADHAAPSASGREPDSDSGQPVLADQLPPTAGSSSSVIDTGWIGRRLGRYQVLSLLGHGGMGTVWRAHDDALRRDVALKILTRRARSNGTCLNTALFMQEARAVAKLQHPSVVSIFEVVDDQEQCFIALELMEGGTLKEHVERVGPIAPAELFGMLVGPARALALAHRRGIVHRDIKPGNLMLDDHGHLKLMDFGLAHVENEDASERIRGRAVGSLGWVAPETVRGRQTTAAGDIYSFGLVMLFALRGRPWLRAESRSKLLDLHQNPPELDLGDIPNLSPDAADMLRKCLAVAPAERYTSAEELAAALEHCADEAPPALPPRRRSHVAVVAVSLCLGIAAGVSVAVYFVGDWLSERIDSYQTPIAVERRPSVQPLSSPDPGVAAAPQRPQSAPPAPDTAEATNVAASPADRRPWPETVNAAELKIIGSQNGRVYHLPTCEGGRKILVANLVRYDSIEAAAADGRHPCRYCKPSVVLTGNPDQEP